MFSLRVTLLMAVCLSLAAADTRPLVLDDVQPPVTLETVLDDYRLASHILPVSYNITLRPYLLESDGVKRFTFDGEVHIEVVPTENTTSVHLHAKNLTFSVSEFWAKPAQGVAAPAGTNFNSVNETNSDTDIVKLTTAATLTANTPYILHFVYTGLMEDDMHGFYKSYYVDDNNVTKWLGSTQFETNHARRAFPSFDEPKFKATFNITLKRHRTFNSVSNTRLIGSYPSTEAGYFEDVFATTPIMSTYLVAFIISEFAARTDDKFRVLARPEYYAQTQYPYNVGIEILQKMGEYLNLDYYTLGNDKMDMAAIPDFSAGAMENWGLLTYRERSLLVDESATTLASRQAIAAVVAHEQAHMWFGDLVTCEWWSYTWLNEGFARYFQYFGTAMAEDKWDLENQFVVDQVQSVMAMDSTNATNPLTDPNTYTPAHLSRMFNSISYNKGASFIRMIKHTMGETEFQLALQNYLVKYSYKSSRPENLLAEWQGTWPDRFKNSSQEIFDSFTTQVGYPLVNAELSSDRMSVRFTQQRFLLKENDGSNASLVYSVPITFTNSISPKFYNTTTNFILNGTAETWNFHHALDWIIVNVQQCGYYRVNYTENNWRSIQTLLANNSWGGVHENNRAQIVDDLFNLARAGLISYSLTLDVIEYLETETHYIPWTSAFNGFSFLAIRLGNDTFNFNSYIQSLTQKAYNKLGFNETETDTALDIYLRTKVLSWACRYGSADCISRAKTYFQSLSTVPKNIRATVYCVGLREGGSTEFEALYNKFKVETVATEETLLQNSFGCVKTQALIERVFNLILSDEIRRQDKSSVLATLYTENNENVSPVFALVTQKFEELAQAMGGYSAVATVISNIAARFTTEQQYADLQTFNKNSGSKFGNSQATLTAAEATVAENLEWAQAKLGVFRSYLAGRNGGTMASALSAVSLVLVALATILRH
ncbi:membrane alanyl aminopeptidase-like [Drosophila bipectinata]|uniref:membrane alanyl aminopeptidase-like n=1 Tax=Drosophila bipectinata TaxID=42026 RepID=UPI001C895132|nr:membrane alanyl aminopeptidase-like [Drosophila bipectinata]